MLTRKAAIGFEAQIAADLAQLGLKSAKGAAARRHTEKELREASGGAP